MVPWPHHFYWFSSAFSFLHLTKFENFSLLVLSLSYTLLNFLHLIDFGSLTASFLLLVYISVEHNGGSNYFPVTPGTDKPHPGPISCHKEGKYYICDIPTPLERAPVPPSGPNCATHIPHTSPCPCVIKWNWPFHWKDVVLFVLCLIQPKKSFLLNFCLKINAFIS